MWQQKNQTCSTSVYLPWQWGQERRWIGRESQCSQSGRREAPTVEDDVEGLRLTTKMTDAPQRPAAARLRWSGPGPWNRIGERICGLGWKKNKSHSAAEINFNDIGWKVQTLKFLWLKFVLLSPRQTQRKLVSIISQSAYTRRDNKQ